MAFDMVQFPQSARQHFRLIRHSTLRVYIELAGHYNFTDMGSWPSNERLAEQTGLKERQVRYCLRELESEFFSVRETFRTMRRMGFLLDERFFSSSNPFYLLPDFLLLDSKDKGLQYRLLQHVISRGGILVPHKRHRAATLQAEDKHFERHKSALGGGTGAHLNYIIERYKEQEQIFLKKADRPEKEIHLTYRQTGQPENILPPAQTKEEYQKELLKAFDRAWGKP